MAVTGQPRPPATPATVVWGLGTGRHLRPLLARGPVLVLAIDVPPSAPLALEERLAPDVLVAARTGTLRVVHGSPQVLARAFQACPQAALHVHVPALDAAPEPAQPLARLVARVHAEQRDAARHRARMRTNVTRNAGVLARATPLHTWAGAARGHVALVLAAGPSLPRALPHLAPWYRRGPVIAVDTALPLLVRAGLDPHVAATVDPHPASMRHLDAGVPRTAVCACQPYAHPDVVAAFTRHVAAAPAGDRLWDVLAPRLDLPRVHTCGTVLLYALQIAHTMAPDAVIVAGADFAPLGAWSHAPGTAHATRDVATPACTRDSRGRALATTRALRQFQDAIEATLATTPIPHLFVDGGGAAVRGATMVAPEALATTGPTPGAGTRWHPPVPAPLAPHQVAARTDLIRRMLAQFDSHGRTTHD